MAFGEPPRDAYGNPISIPPHNQVILNPNDIPVARRTKIGLGDGLVATDDPDSDCTRISFSGGGGQLSIVNTSAALRTFSGGLSASQMYRTRGALAVEDGGGAFWRWDATSTATDDGVLTIKKTSVGTGRFRYVDMSQGAVYNALSAIPETGSSRSVSFDRTGSTAMRAELWRVTKILRDNGFAGIVFPRGIYQCFGDEQIGASALPMVSFSILGTSGTVFRGPSHDPGNVSCSLSVYAYCYGDTYPGTTIIQDNNPNKPSWSQTFLGYERTLTGVSDIVTDAMQAGDTVVTYLGAEPTDANGWCARWQIAEIASVTPTTGNAGNVTLVQPIPGPMPPSVGINTIRLTQTDHTLKKLSGFQDGTSFIGIDFDNVSVNPAGCRNFYMDCTWKYCTFGLNMFMCENITIPRIYAETVTGANIGPGAYSHYGGFIVCQSTYVTRIGSLKIANLDGVFMIDEELTPNGTSIDSADIVINGELSVNGTTSVTTGISGGITIRNMTVRGGYGNLNFSPLTDIGTMNLITGSSSPVTTNTLINVRAENIGVLNYRDRTYRSKTRGVFAVPIKASTTKTHNLPFYGVICGMRMYPTSLTGITTLRAINNDGFNSGYDLLSLFPTANAWNDIGPANSLGSMGDNVAPNLTSISVVTDGTAVDGNSILFDIQYFMLDPVNGATNLSDNTYPSIVSGAVAPSANAQYVGQQYFDTVAGAIYDAISTGSGASDWSPRGLPFIGGGTVAGNAAFTPEITTDDYGRVTNISGIAIAIDAGQVNAGTLNQARLPVGYPVIVASADFTASSFASSWTAGAYRRVEIRLSLSSGNAADPTLVLGGVSTSVYSSINLTQITGGAGVSTQVDQTNAASWTLTGLGQNAFVEIDVSCPNIQAKHAILRGSTYGVNVTKVDGVCRVNDVSNQVSGLTVTFGGSTQGHYEIIGWP